MEYNLLKLYKNNKKQTNKKPTQTKQKQVNLSWGDKSQIIYEDT